MKLDISRSLVCTSEDCTVLFAEWHLSDIVRYAHLQKTGWLSNRSQIRFTWFFSTFVSLIALSSQMLPVCMTESTGSPCVFEFRQLPPSHHLMSVPTVTVPCADTDGQMFSPVDCMLVGYQMCKV